MCVTGVKSICEFCGFLPIDGVTASPIIVAGQGKGPERVAAESAEVPTWGQKIIA